MLYGLYNILKLTNLYRAVQKQCTDAVDTQSNHKYAQCDAYHRDQTFCLTEKYKNIRRHTYVIKGMFGSDL